MSIAMRIISTPGAPHRGVVPVRQIALNVPSVTWAVKVTRNHHRRILFGPYPAKRPKTDLWQALYGKILRRYVWNIVRRAMNRPRPVRWKLTLPWVRNEAPKSAGSPKTELALPGVVQRRLDTATGLPCETQFATDFRPRVGVVRRLAYACPANGRGSRRFPRKYNAGP